MREPMTTLHRDEKEERKKRYIRDDSLVYRERDGCPLNM